MSGISVVILKEVFDKFRKKVKKHHTLDVLCRYNSREVSENQRKINY